MKINGETSDDSIAWISASQDLVVKVDFRLPGGTRVVREIYDIQYSEPDPAVFAIPSGYTVE